MSEHTILVIEDDEVLSRMLYNELSSEGFKVIRAFDGEEGLRLILTEKPSLVLLDLVLPKMDGLAVLKKLRQGSWAKDVPVILLTNMDSLENAGEAISLGVQDYLIKSDWRIEDVIAKVKARLGL